MTDAAATRADALAAENRALRRELAELQAAHATLKARDDLVTAITENVPALIAFWDADLICRFANTAHGDRFGIPAARMIGMSAAEVLGAQVAEEVLPLMREALAGKTVQYVKPFPQGDGNIAWSETTYTPYRRGSEVSGFIVLRFDVTKRKQLEDELELARAQAQDVSSVLARLIELTADAVGAEFLDRTVQAMSELLSADLVFVARVDHGPPRRADVLTAWGGGRFLPLWSYDVDRRPSRFLYTDPAEDPPCVLRHCGSVIIPSGVSRMFPSGETEQYDAAVSVAVLDPKGQVIAQLTAAFVTPLEDPRRQRLLFETLRFFAARIEPELERMEVEAARAAAAAALLDEKERLRVTLHAIGDGVIVTDAQERITMINAAAEQLTGWQAADAVGRALPEVAPLRQSTAIEPSEPLARTALLAGEVVAPSVDATLVRADGTSRVIDASAAPIFRPDGGLIGSITVLHDVTEARALLSRVSDLAHFDSLTGLPNRSMLRQQLERSLAMSERSGRKCAVLFLDMDRFKHVNDTLGHAIGDQLLREVAQRLQRTVRDTDTVARLGGDEFVVLLNDLMDAAIVGTIAKKILETVVAIDRIAGHDIHVSFSIGVAIYPDDGDNVEVLLKRADAAMYQAKDAGRNTFAFFDPEMDRAMQRRNEIRVGLTRAVQLHQFLLLYQPKVDLASGGIVGAEALIRWQPERGRTISPMDFIPIAEETGAIGPIGDWVLQEACRQMRAWRDQGLPPVRVAVNVSMKSLRDPGFAAKLQAALAAADLPAETLEIEITETAAMTDPERPLAILRELRSLGVHVAIDDFGTGFSSLAHLQRLPVDTIKIDRSFVNNIVHSDDDATLIRTILSMASSLRKHVVAEGVETEAQRAMLLRFGCTEAQGYLFAKPLKPDAFAELLGGQVGSASRARKRVRSPGERMPLA